MKLCWYYPQKLGVCIREKYAEATRNYEQSTFITSTWAALNITGIYRYHGVHFPCVSNEKPSQTEGWRYREEGSIGTWLPRARPVLPFAPFSLSPGRDFGLGWERRQRCEGHLPLPPSRTLTKGGHGRTRSMTDREDCRSSRRRVTATKRMHEGVPCGSTQRRNELQLLHTPYVRDKIYFASIVHD